MILRVIEPDDDDPDAVAQCPRNVPARAAPRGQREDTRPLIRVVDPDEDAPWTAGAAERWLLSLFDDKHSGIR